MLRQSAVMCLWVCSLAGQTLQDLEQQAKTTQTEFDRTLDEIESLEPAEPGGVYNCSNAAKLVGLYDQLETLAARLAGQRDAIVDKHIANHASGIKLLTAEIARVEARIKRIEETEIKAAETALATARASGQGEVRGPSAVHLAKTTAARTRELDQLRRELELLKKTRRLQDSAEKNNTTEGDLLQSLKSLYRNGGEFYKSDALYRRTQLKEDCPSSGYPELPPERPRRR